MVIEKRQLHLSKVILISSNMILKFRILSSQGQIHKDDGSKIEIKEYFCIFFIKKEKIIWWNEGDVQGKFNEPIKCFQTPFEY